MTTHLPWRKNVGMIILNHQNEMWMGRRYDAKDYPWQFPQGGINGHETPEQAMWRELEEETGIKQANMIAEHPIWLYYEFPTDIAAHHHFCGQQQKWFLLRYSGSDTDIHINNEFSSWAWAPWQDFTTIIQTVVVPFKRQVYQNLQQAFAQWL